MTEAAPPLYTGPIRVAFLEELWMKAGDKGTVRKTVAALGPVEASFALSPDAGCYGDDEVTDHIRVRWRQNAANLLRPVMQDHPDSTPVVFVSTANVGLRPSFGILRDTLGRPNLWLDVHADFEKYDFDAHSFPAAPTMINAFADKESWARYGDLERAGHKRVLLPYLPELQGLPSGSEARARLAERYHITFERPLMAVLVGRSSLMAMNQIFAAADALSADLLVSTSPRSGDIGYWKCKWQENALIFHEFGESPEPNPYADFIAAADIFAVDSDSMSMPADALARGKPVALFGHMTADNNNQNLVTHGFATILTGADTKWQPPPPHETPCAILNRVVRAELAKLLSPR